MTALPQARSQAKTQARTQVGGVVGGASGPSYDTDAQDYFTRAESLGGSFDLSGISGTYTESYVKTAISDFVAGCKTDLIWTKITEAYLLVGVTFSGVLAKLKHGGTAALTNVNFVSGDYLAAGSGAGLKGNGSTKRIITGVSQSTIFSLSLGVYQTTFDEPNDYRGIFGNIQSPNKGLGISVDVSPLCGYSQWGLFRSVTGWTSPKFVGVTVGAAGAAVPYLNGSATTATVTFTDRPSTDQYAIFDLNATQGGYSSSRLSFAFIGDILSAGDWANLSTRINALMTALGANVY